MREPQRRLGRGLATLLGQPEHQVEQATEALHVIDIDAIRPNPAQPRTAIAPAALDELAQSIAQQGVLQPILVRPSGTPTEFEIVAGERRWRAAKQAGLSVVPCVVRSFDDRSTALAALVENLQREDLNVLDEAAGYRRAVDGFDLSHDDLAKAIGKSRSHVANTLRLLNLPDPALAALRDGRITAGHGRALLAHIDPEAALEQILSGKLNVRDAEALSSRADGKPNEEGRPLKSRRLTDKSADSLNLEREVSELLGLAVKITERNGRGKLVVEFHNHDQLEGLLRLFGRETAN